MSPNTNRNPHRNTYKRYYVDQDDTGYNMEGMQTTFFDPPMPMRGSNPYTRA